ncbi:MAG: ferritin family protein, partial [Desulfobacterales bacterium]
MPEDKTTEILKNAILLEKRGNTFYRKVSEQASGNAVKDFFKKMADEEAKHVHILTDQFKAYRQDKKFMPGDYQDDRSSSFVADILTQELK